MIFAETKLKGCYVIELKPFADDRGWFARTFCKEEFEKIGHYKEWVQLNHSFTKQKGSIRGMHYQVPPFAEIKLVRCIAGGVVDVVVDIRKNSPTFLQWIKVELSTQNKNMIYIPEGFAHGFQTLTDDVELIYHHSNFYKPNVEAGLNFMDAKLNINWPLPITNISDKDKQHKYITEDFLGV
ncbi:MAG: dTDP-4-dehydrorhamnose 3,5-epimerase [Ferruginibacter sp.]|nr:dTDP-4-dehydrorhamnose 3,5-epimerase [Ferruginibacter sp.]